MSTRSCILYILMLLAELLRIKTGCYLDRGCARKVQGLLHLVGLRWSVWVIMLQRVLHVLFLLGLPGQKS